jgi:hypothetical protein
VRSVRPEPLAIGITQEQVYFSYTSLSNPGSIQTPLIIFSTKYSFSLKSVLKSDLKTGCNPITHKPNNPLYWDDGLRSDLFTGMSEKVLHIADQVGIFHANDGQTISRRMRIGSLEGARKIGCDYYVERHPTVSIRVGTNEFTPP